jgi:hypothetical protein
LIDLDSAYRGLKGGGLEAIPAPVAFPHEVFDEVLRTAPGGYYPSPDTD